MEPRSLFKILALALCIRPDQAKTNSLVLQFSAPGDFVIGGLFAFHSKVRYEAQPQIPTCYSFYTRGYQRHLGMHFAIDEINNSTSLLPGIKLGYEIHNTCNNVVVATKPTITFLSKYPSDSGLEAQCNYTNYKPRVIAVVGPDSSELSMVLSRLLNFLSIPEISHASTNDNLSDRELYPSFFRTVPSDKNQAQALVQLLRKFHWNWVAALATDDKYGRQALELFVPLALSKDTCIAYEAILPSAQEKSERREQLVKITSQLVESGIKITVVFAQPNQAEELMAVVVERGITGKVWIASPGQSQSNSIISWEDEQCPECGNLTLANLTSLIYQERFYATFNTYKAIYVIAHALHQLLQCNTTSQKCNADQEVYPWQLLEEIANVNFTVESQPVYFSKTGNPPTGYDLVLWSWNATRVPEFISIGSYDALQRELTVDESKIQWHTRDKKVPTSKCSQDCTAGQKRHLRGEHNCCYQCEDCPPGYFQDKNDPNECAKCFEHQWFLEENRTCQERTIEYLEVTDLLPIVMVALTILALVQMAVVTGIFVKYWSTPAMRYVGSFPTLLIILSSTCLCSSCFFFVIKPTVWVCKFRQPFFFISFTISLATLLGKVVQSFGLDQALKRPLLRRHSLALCVLLNTAIQSLLCVFWYLWDPPSLEEKTNMEKTILLQCQDVSFPGFGLLLAYNYGLSVVCCICSFWGNNSQQAQLKTFKAISFAMVLIIIIWTLFVPTYATSQGKFVSLFQVFAGLASVFAIFGSCYYRVCYIALFVPHMNTDSHFCSQPQDAPMEEDADTAEIK
ncbi:G-protein coupled receptor family C group 6 member A-like [Eublepharis macularius]|uniref:G-protein coupled receptor family C group 6 member A-like n=1 Tax=Eublepharis macularius TaxID=481883 RepID=A0AA97KKS7_EUBMA|nr:G-protein coupled receptor family C group 6 member A-like [Eublepharis macularius]